MGKRNRRRCTFYQIAVVDYTRLQVVASDGLTERLCNAPRVADQQSNRSLAH